MTLIKLYQIFKCVSILVSQITMKRLQKFLFCSPSTGIFTLNQNLKMELRLHKHILSYSIFPEYFLNIVCDSLIICTHGDFIENNSPFYRPSDHFIVDQMNNITDVYY